MTDNFDPDALDREYERRWAQHKTDSDTGAPAPRKDSGKKGNRMPRTAKTNSVLKFIRDPRTRLFSGVALLCWATYLLVASISFFTTGADDQSATMHRSISEMAENPEGVSNLGGAVGAFLSHNFITNGLGIGSLVLIAYFFMLGWRLLDRRKINFWGLTMRSLIDAIALSMVAGYVALETGVNSWLQWGGVHGYEINEYLIRVIGQIGALLVNILLIALVAAIYLNELRILYVAYRKRVRAYKAKLEAERQAREERRRMMEEQMKQSDREIAGQPEEETEGTDAPAYDPYAPSGVQPIIVDFDSDTFDENDAEEPEIPTHYTAPRSEEPAAVKEPEKQPEEPSHEDIPEEEPEPQETVYPDTYYPEQELQDEEPEDETGADKISAEPEMKVNINEIEEATTILDIPYDPTADLPHYHFPSIELLRDISVKTDCVDETEMEENKNRITETLRNYRINISKIEATVGPTVTLYEIVPAEGVRIAQIKRLEDDIALSLAALGIRIIAPIPGRGTIGIEVPNKEPQMVPIRSIIGSKAFQECKYELPMAFGSTISKEVFIKDLASVPHLLVAGATGQGKSVGLNTIITSLLYKKHPSELKFVLIDPKTVEFALYSKIERHYLAKLPDEENAIVCDPTKVVTTLNSLCVEMENRFKLFNEAEERNLLDYNNKFISRRLNPEKGHQYLPYIVVIIDEFADLIMVAGKEVEKPVARLAQKGRAAGIHIILATQRPSTDVITGMIKANFPGRVAFRVMQMVDSRTILDRPGANQLIGKGDMLISLGGEVTRVQCAFISTDEVVSICNAVSEQRGYPEAYELPEYIADGDNSLASMGNVNDRDSLFEEAARFTVASGTASTSSLQRRYQIGYNRAGRIMDQLEAAGIVGPASGAKPRSVLMDSLQLERLLELPDL